MKFLVFPYLFFFSLSLQSTVVEKTLAQIGEEMVSLIDFKNFRKQMRLKLVPPSLLLKEKYQRTSLLQNKNTLLEFLIDRNILYQTAKKEKLPEAAEKDIEARFHQLKGSVSHKTFATKLKKAGLSPKTLKKQILMDLTNDLLLSQFVISKITISEQDIESYHFNKYNKALFKTFEYEFVSVRFSEDKKEAILKKFLDKDLTDLEKTALSLGLEYKTSRLKQKDIQPVFKKELDKLSVSQISPILIFGDSYYILQLKWKHPKISPDEQKRKNQIEKLLYEKKRKEEIHKWIEEKKASFSIIRHSL